MAMSMHVFYVCRYRNFTVSVDIFLSLFWSFLRDLNVVSHAIFLPVILVGIEELLALEFLPKFLWVGRFSTCKTCTFEENLEVRWGHPKNWVVSEVSEEVIFEVM